MRQKSRITTSIQAIQKVVRNKDNGLESMHVKKILRLAFTILEERKNPKQMDGDS